MHGSPVQLQFSNANIKYKRMHSSRMRTAHTLTVGGRGGGGVSGKRRQEIDNSDTI